VDPALSQAGTTCIAPLVPPPTPLELLARVAGRPCPALLEGAADQAGLGRWSYLAWDPVHIIHATPEEWPAVEARLRTTLHHLPRSPNLPPFAGGWIGWFGYELGRAFDRQPEPAQDDVAAPAVALALYDTVVAWDHLTGQAWLISTGVDADGIPSSPRADERLALRVREMAEHAPADRPLAQPGTTPHGVVPITAFAEAPPTLRGDVTPAQYQHAVEHVIECILAGDLFQANIAQRFVAEWQGTAPALYQALRSRTPAALAAYLDHGPHVVLSASPELFLRYDPVSRRIETRPIKGTRPRGACPEEDAHLRDELNASAKDRAENVMIVDLLRNDLARVARTGSVAVPALCIAEAHPTVHHLVSTVTADLAPEHDALDLLRATFPGGSITGAPKLKAMEMIAALEPVARGVYCGAIGWLGLDGAMMLSVAIRTTTLAGHVAVVHAGGGITARSTAADEYRETLDKARGIIAALAEGA
jgi:para-aminobenzoate synthetase component 1